MTIVQLLETLYGIQKLYLIGNCDQNSCTILFVGESGNSTNTASSESEKLKLKDVLTELLNKVADQWEDICILLDIEDGQLSQIKSDNANSKTCFREMLRIWLKRVNPSPSWSELAGALEILGNENTASQIRTKHCMQPLIILAITVSNNIICTVIIHFNLHHNLLL